MRNSKTTLIKRKSKQAREPEQPEQLASSQRRLNTLTVILKKDFKTPELGKREISFFSSSSGAKNNHLSTGKKE